MPTYNFADFGNQAAFMQAFGNTVTEVEVTTPPIALALNDVIRLCRVAGGSRLFDLSNFNGDLDTGTTLQFSLGYQKVNSAGVQADNLTYFGSALTTWQAAVLGSAPTRYAFTAIDFNEDMYIVATVTAAATGVTGTPAITCRATSKARGMK